MVQRNSDKMICDTEQTSLKLICEKIFGKKIVQMASLRRVTAKNNSKMDQVKRYKLFWEIGEKIGKTKNC